MVNVIAYDKVITAIKKVKQKRGGYGILGGVWVLLEAYWSGKASLSEGFKQMKE